MDATLFPLIKQEPDSDNEVDPLALNIDLRKVKVGSVNIFFLQFMRLENTISLHTVCWYGTFKVLGSVLWRCDCVHCGNLTLRS